MTLTRLARSNAFEINNALNTLKGARLTVNLTGKARKSAIDVGRLLIITETVHSSTPSATGVIAKDTYRLNADRLGSQSEKGKWLNTPENITVDEFSTSTHVDKPQILLQISNVDLVFELDTGAAVSLVGPDIWKRIGSPHLTSPKIQLFSYGKQPIPVKGECNVTVSYNGGNQTLPLIVVEKAGTYLFALDWINAFQVDVNALL